MQLVIVESPTKANTIEKFLGSGYRVLSSYGHIRDLPKAEFGIDVENNFQPKYIVPLKAKKTVSALKKAVENTNLVILATDEDREGEAIAYHLSYLLNLDGKKEYQRIVFHEITKSAIEEALNNPRRIDMALVDAQQARRILDRVVGYKLSPFLWKKVARGLSAGRVQSVAVRLVVEREREIQRFTPQEYWTIEALLKKLKDGEFKAILIQKDNKSLDKLEIKNEKEAEKIIKELNGAEYKVVNVDKKEIKRNPLPPFTTSTMQQEAWKKLRFPAKLTMRIAQNLYENGLITYHRTDSLNISNQSLFSAKNFIEKNYGKNYWAGFPRKYKAKGKVQEAHEAIRPTYPDKTPGSLIKSEKEKLEEKQFKIYDLIWRRFIASQMTEALFDSTKIDILATKDKEQKKDSYTFRATGQILKFDGFLKVYPLKFEESLLPPLKENELLELMKLIPNQHFTQPPPRYTEASLIKELEKNGIGRPSTYAPIISTIQTRNYVMKDDKRRFQPTEIGTVVNDLLVNHFPKIVDIGFTAKMEEDLDKIANSKRKWIPVIKEFYVPFEKNLKQKEKEVPHKKLTYKKTKKTCPHCGGDIVIKLGRYGKFYACSNFPKCKYTEPLEKNTLGIKCPKCRKGEIVEKRTKKGKIFYGCSDWPQCDFALWDKPINEKCPKCKSILIETKRKQIKCSNKECDFKK